MMSWRDRVRFEVKKRRKDWREYFRERELNFAKERLKSFDIVSNDEIKIKMNLYSKNVCVYDIEKVQQLFYFGLLF